MLEQRKLEENRRLEEQIKLEKHVHWELKESENTNNEVKKPQKSPSMTDIGIKREENIHKYLPKECSLRAKESS